MSGLDREEVFTRDGHLLDLVVDLLLVDELPPGSRELVEPHLDECARCAARVAAAQAVVASPLPPLNLPAPVPASVHVLRPPRRALWSSVGIGLAAAAAVAVAVLPTAPTPEFRSRGGELTLQVYRHDGEQAAPIRSGDEILPGERLGFRVELAQPGHLMILGMDSRGEIYPCYPQDQVGNAVPVGADESLRDLPTAVRIDETPGSERIVALVCERSFSAATMRGWLGSAVPGPDGALPLLQDGCVQEEVLLVKSAGEAR